MTDTTTARVHINSCDTRGIKAKATEHENYMGAYDPKTFVAAVTALLEQRTIEFTD